MPEEASTNVANETAVSNPDATNQQSAPITSPDDAHSQPQKPQSQNPQTPRSKNKLLPVVIILAILTLTGLGTSIYFGIHSSNQASEISDLKSKLDNQKPSDQPSTPEDPEAPENPDEPAITPELRAEVLSAVPGGLSFSTAKCLNSDDANVIHTTYNQLNKYNTFANLNWNLDDHTGDLHINWDAAKELYGLTTDKTGTETISTFGPQGSSVIDAFVVTFGQSSGDETILFLMTDGTVEYIPLRKALTDNNFSSYGKLSDVANVIKIFTVMTGIRNGTGGGINVIAQRADGNYYELYSIIHATGNYQ